ncbi:MAG TPA: hypothetical protein VMW09_08665 [Desulfatiglandales bacterium]|nr:hypothetical protein [Desulfatiglandales bacterium]
MVEIEKLAIGMHYIGIYEKLKEMIPEYQINRNNLGRFGYGTICEKSLKV